MGSLEFDGDSHTRKENWFGMTRSDGPPNSTLYSYWAKPKRILSHILYLVSYISIIPQPAKNCDPQNRPGVYFFVSLSIIGAGGNAYENSGSNDKSGDKDPAGGAGGSSRPDPGPV